LAAAALGAGVFAYAGCGGGDDNGSTSANATSAEIPTITQPAQPAPNGGSTPTTPKPPGPNSANGAGSGNAPPGARPILRQLGAFQDCLSRQGVSIQTLRGAGASQVQERNPEQFRAQVEKAFACISELPPRLRAQAEQLKRRFEQRNP
jgi:hypothetical protein